MLHGSSSEAVVGATEGSAELAGKPNGPQGRALSRPVAEGAREGESVGWTDGLGDVWEDAHAASATTNTAPLARLTPFGMDR